MPRNVSHHFTATFDLIPFQETAQTGVHALLLAPAWRPVFLLPFSWMPLHTQSQLVILKFWPFWVMPKGLEFSVVALFVFFVCRTLWIGSDLKLFQMWGAAGETTLTRFFPQWALWCGEHTFTGINQNKETSVKCGGEALFVPPKFFALCTSEHRNSGIADASMPAFIIQFSRSLKLPSHTWSDQE